MGFRTTEVSLTNREEHYDAGEYFCLRLRLRKCRDVIGQRPLKAARVNRSIRRRKSSEFSSISGHSSRPARIEGDFRVFQFSTHRLFINPASSNLTLQPSSSSSSSCSAETIPAKTTGKGASDASHLALLKNKDVEEPPTGRIMFLPQRRLKRR